MSWEIVVGIETHAQLQTRSKIFSGASSAFGAAPNTQACAVDVALPGVLPVLNRAAVELAVRFGLAIGASINRRSVFARKNYFYPDLPKGYQISQYEAPIVQGGTLAIVLLEGDKTIRITRAHLEEDAGKSLHEDFHGMSGIDLNRAGTPLLEIVSEPDLRGAREAVTYARALHALVRWIGICDGNMQEGSFRCDANVSVRRAGDAKLGTRCEIKNLNSFRFIERAIEFEARRQIGVLEDGGRVEQQTRLYDPERDETRAMRSKEEAQDYRYFPDPDLLPLVVSEEDIERIRSSLPELPRAVRERLVVEYGVSAYEAGILTATRATANYFERSTERLLQLNPAKWGGTGSGPSDARQMYGGAIAKSVLGLLAAQLNRDALEIEQSPVTPEQFALLHSRHIDDTLSAKAVREVFQALWESNSRDEDAIDAIIEAKGLRQISDAGAIEKLVDDVLAANSKLVEDYRAGKEKAFNALVGQVMKASRGKANPEQVNLLLRARLGG
ncbi:MAG TPA: Asp-tRNA(Asn)/Glu-tRNA(Gln) amidotransferase subunit GatB [Burkholderiales bacterium]|nr:Asp-tRNA(Asn)/Glu-tRNA(Gln) amidotransferase subunit GatB [Burkholderiales bacterium]